MDQKPEPLGLSQQLNRRQVFAEDQGAVAGVGVGGGNG